MTIKDLVDYCKAQAISDKLYPNELGEYRFICRHYSKTFNTPLHVVENELDPERVVMAYFQDMYDELDTDKHLEDILDMIYEMQDPTYSREKREEVNEFMRQAEREEKERIKSGKPIHPRIKLVQEVTLKDLPEEEPNKEVLPTSGSIDLSRFNLDKEE